MKTMYQGGERIEHKATGGHGVVLDAPDKKGFVAVEFDDGDLMVVHVDNIRRELEEEVAYA